MGGLGIFYLFNPIEAFDSNVISFFAAFIASVGLIWAMNGLKDMAVKDMRRSVLALEATNRQNTVDYGLIRDVLLNPSQYRSFLMEAYERAFEDGQIDDDELEELRVHPSGARHERSGGPGRRCSGCGLRRTQGWAPVRGRAWIDSNSSLDGRCLRQGHRSPDRLP